MVGHDPSVLASLEAGLDGAIAATGSVMPEILLGIAKAHKAGDSQTAQRHLDKLNKWYWEALSELSTAFISILCACENICNRDVLLPCAQMPSVRLITLLSQMN